MQTETGIASVRTGWQLSIFAAIATLVYKFSGVTITTDQLLFLSPVVGIVGGVFYRFSRFISEKYPSVGYVLFGTKKTPTKYEEN